MEDLISILSGMRRELECLVKSLAQVKKSHTQCLTEEWNRKPQVLKMLGISKRTLGKLTHTGQLPFAKINGILYFRTSDVERLLNDHYVSPSAESTALTSKTNNNGNE